MRERYRDYEHLARLGLLFLAGIAAFVVVKAVLVPDGFGEFGHYRAGALDDNRARPATFAGQAACGDCHEDVLEAKSGGRHAGVHCEACHGALSAHAQDPTESGVTKPAIPDLCVVCHLENVAKPVSFPQIDPAQHAGSTSCAECHAPHAPSVAKEGRP